LYGSIAATVLLLIGIGFYLSMETPKSYEDEIALNEIDENEIQILLDSLMQQNKIEAENLKTQRFSKKEQEPLPTVSLREEQKKQETELIDFDTFEDEHAQAVENLEQQSLPPIKQANNKKSAVFYWIAGIVILLLVGFCGYLIRKSVKRNNLHRIP